MDKTPLLTSPRQQTPPSTPGTAPSNEEQSHARSSDNRNAAEGNMTHVIWGGMESPDSSSISCASGVSSGNGSQKEHKKERPQRVLTSKVEFLNFSECSSSASRSTEAKPRRTAADTPAGSSFHHASGPAPEDSALPDHADDGEASHDEHDEQDGEMPVMGELGDLPSVGSAEHFLNTCRPCLFAHSKIGCPQGSQCLWCHFYHRISRKPRPCKKKRERYRKLMERSECEMRAQQYDD
mmetsp:Transcript_76058/g.131781  ORF Transcript_76058/g.131781 Transcript_76058/m.131781 type:complete len:238 (+) Transcript_76058:112-825(+)